MNSRSMYPAGLGVCLAFLAVSAVGQSQMGSSSHSAMAPSKTATANTTTNAAAGTTTAPPSGTKGTKKHHSTAHHQMHAKPESMAAASAADGRESAYRAALRSCVAGPAAQKERCLDDAIARHGRSG